MDAPVTARPSLPFHEHPHRLKCRLQALAESYACAEYHGIDRWQLAIPIDELESAGVSQSELRRLVAGGLLAHAREITSCDDPYRVFDSSGRFTFSASSCFVLTPLGHAFAKNDSRVAAGSECSEIEQSDHTLSLIHI